MNVHTGEVTVEAGGKSYTLRLDLNAMVMLEGVFSTPQKLMTFPAIMDAMQQGSVTHIRAFVWAALRAHHPDLTLDDAGNIIFAAGGLNGFNAQLQALAESAKPDHADLDALGVHERERPIGPVKLSRKSSSPRGIGGGSTSKHAAAG